MKNYLDGLGVSVEKAEQAVGGHDIKEFAPGDIAPLVVGSQTIVDDKIRGAPGLEGGEQVRADEAGSPGDYNHGIFLLRLAML